jgi:hypothetical protein
VAAAKSTKSVAAPDAQIVAAIVENWPIGLNVPLLPKPLVYDNGLTGHFVPMFLIQVRGARRFT